MMSRGSFREETIGGLNETGSAGRGKGPAGAMNNIKTPFGSPGFLSVIFIRFNDDFRSSPIVMADVKTPVQQRNTAFVSFYKNR
jgi:hypothetical protein